MESITLTRPDDMHLHLRDTDALQTTVPATAKQFSRAIVMPNLKPAVTTLDAAKEYQQRILAQMPINLDFQPLMTLYLTPEMDPTQMRVAKDSGVIFGVKLYPQGATTHSEEGVGSMAALFPVFEAMEKVGLPLLVHGETTGDDDIFDRERFFIEKHLAPLVEKFPNLKVVLEHITTQVAVDFVSAANKHVAATITPHHLMYNRNEMLAGGIKPHMYCMPVLKREHHRQALIEAAISGNPKFFLGTDSAPHARKTKETACGCAGIFSALSAIELYATVFEQAEALDKLEGFASFFGADFYGLPRNEDTITLVQEEWTVPESVPYVDGDELVPMYAGQTLNWKLSEPER